MRIGHGYDVHRLAEGRRLVLGGVEIEYALGLLGHSDADVLLHALADAILGAAAAGDIGKMFPDSDEKYKDADSLELLKAAYGSVADKYSLVNADVTVIVQRPIISPYTEQMRKNISGALGVDIGCISVKATTEEGLGFTGRGEGIAAHALVLLQEKG